jgi:LysR family hydrogen peroxide-inducible transcriptional activator
MNFQQLEYVLAVKEHRNFGKAAAACFVTQPTLSAMILKLEEELGVTIFDRSVSPVAITEVGDAVISLVQKVLSAASELKNVAANSGNKVRGEYHVGIIPTIAPSLLKCFVELSKTYGDLKLNVVEAHTATIIGKLRSAELHAAIASTPLFQSDLVEMPLYLEPLNIFVSNEEKKIKKYVLPKDIKPEKVWMLEEGNCLSKQFEHICSLKSEVTKHQNLQIKTGSIESLLKLVELNNGITILPELFCRELDDERKKQIRKFKSPQPCRQVSLVFKKGAAKEIINNAVSAHIMHYIKNMMPQNFKKDNIQIVPAL